MFVPITRVGDVIGGTGDLPYLWPHLLEFTIEPTLVGVAIHAEFSVAGSLSVPSHTRRKGWSSGNRILGRCSDHR